MSKNLQNPPAYRTPELLTAWGEVIDKITILEIKNEKLSDHSALANVERELKILGAVAEEPLKQSPKLMSLKQQLSSVNRTLWDIEDDIRKKEHKKEFDATFIELARSVYITNDERARIKKEINILLQSQIVEEKSYEQY